MCRSHSGRLLRLRIIATILAQCSALEVDELPWRTAQDRRASRKRRNENGDWASRSGTYTFGLVLALLLGLGVGEAYAVNERLNWNGVRKGQAQVEDLLRSFIQQRPVGPTYDQGSIAGIGTKPLCCCSIGLGHESRTFGRKSSFSM